MVSSTPRKRPLTPRPSSRKLSEVARNVVIPDGIVTTEWPRAEAVCRGFGVEFDGWQRGLGAAALGKRSDGFYAATVGGIVLSIPRQVGKTFFVGMVIIALCVLKPGSLILWTAHRVPTATKTFESLKGYVSRKRIAPLVLATRDSHGEQQIVFRNGSKIMFGAREGGFGRGFDCVDVEVFDEAQILSEKALEDMVAATNQTRWEAGALLWFMGTPPRPVDPGDEFRLRRQEALSGDSQDMLFVEMSADRDAKLDDHAQWAKANPSFPHRTPLASMKRLRKQLRSDASWKREGLGIWDEATLARAIPADLWAKTAVAEAPDGLRSFAVAFSFKGDRVALAGARKHADGVHGELLDLSGRLDPETGVGPLADWLVARKERSAEFAILGAAGETLVRELQDRGVGKRQIHVLSTKEYKAACALVEDGLKAGTVTHKLDGQTALDESVAVVDKKIRGDGFGWRSTADDGDEVPFEAFTAAVYAARTTKRNPGRKVKIL